MLYFFLGQSRPAETAKGRHYCLRTDEIKQLMKRIKLTGVESMMLGLRHSSKAGLQGITPQDMEGYLSHLLGEFVWQRAEKSADVFDSFLVRRGISSSSTSTTSKRA